MYEVHLIVSLEQIIRERRLAVIQIGSLHGDMRLLLGSVTTELPEVTIELTDVVSCFYKASPKKAIDIVRVSEPGSFGWWLGERRGEYTQIQLDGLIALARSISHRPFRQDKDLNFPG